MRIMALKLNNRRVLDVVDLHWGRNWCAKYEMIAGRAEIESVSVERRAMTRS